MKQMITAKVKLHTTPEQFAQVRAVQLAYRDALNYTSRYAYAHGKMSNQQALQRGVYAEIRTRYKLSSQMACNVPRKARSDVQSLVDEGEAKRPGTP